MNAQPLVPKVVLVTNIPAPYRIPEWNRLAADERIDFTVIFCAETEPNREWDLAGFEFKYLYLKEAYLTNKGRYIHNNPDIFGKLGTLNPDVIITGGFNPTFVYAFLFAWWNCRKHICFTDGTFLSERTLTVFHKLVRRMVFRRSAAFIGASEGSIEMYRSWRLPSDRIFKSPLCVENDRFSSIIDRTKKFDFVFCSRFAEVKNPLFVFDVAERTAEFLGRAVSVLFIGSGQLESEMRKRASQARSVNSVFHGFAMQAELPELYGRARIFLFPTSWDPWGVVVNEACAAGLPIIISPFAGAAGEIVQDGVNGFVIELDADRWAEKSTQLLSDKRLYEGFSQNSVELVADRTPERAAAGMMSAIFAAYGKGADSRCL